MDKILTAKQFLKERFGFNLFGSEVDSMMNGVQQYADYYAREMMKWTDPNKQMPPLVDDCVRYLCIINNAESVVLTYILNEDKTAGKFYMDFGARNYFEDWTKCVTAYMPVPVFDQFLTDQKKK